MSTLARLCVAAAVAWGVTITPGSLLAQQKNEILTWGENSPDSLDPHTQRGASGMIGQLNLYDTLYRYQGDPPKLVPWLAESHTMSADGKTYEFKLRRGIKYHDGSEMTAEDVVYSFQRILGLKRNAASAFLPILKAENVTAPDKYTVRFVLNRPYAPFMAAIPLAAIVNPRIVKQHVKDNDWGSAWLSANSAGSGPYKAIPGSFISYEKVSFEWFPDYFMGWHDKPIKQVNVQYVKSTSTRILALLRGEIDATDSRLGADGVARIEKAKGVHVARNESMRLYMISMHTQRPPLDNVHVRRALSYAFNYRGFIENAMQNLTVRNPAPIPNNLWGYPKDIKGYEYNLEKAKAELELAKKQGVDLSRPLLLHITSGSPPSDYASQILQSDLRKLGIELRVVPSTFPQLATMARKIDTSPDLWAHWVSAYFIDPENWIGQLYDSSFHGNWKGMTWYKNAEVDQLLREARESSDQAKRAELYQKAARLVVEDAPAIYIDNAVEVRGLSDRIKGYEFSPVGGGAEFRTMSLTR